MKEFNLAAAMSFIKDTENEDWIKEYKITRNPKNGYYRIRIITQNDLWLEVI